MSKKAQPDSKERTIQYVNSDKASAKEYAYLKSKHYVDAKSTNQTLGTIRFAIPDATDNNYKMTNHVDGDDE
jgi:hypothetical protein